MSFPLEKRCRKCDAIKPLDEFYVQSAGLHGRTSHCMVCSRAEHKAYKESKIPVSVKEARVRKQTLLSQGLKSCSKCEEVKPIGEFFLQKGRPTSSCKNCMMERHRGWKEENKQHMLDYVREYSSREEVASRKSSARKHRRQESPKWTMQITLRHGLNRRPTDNPATIDDLMAKFVANGGRCALTGIVMTWVKGKVLPTSISLDRIDPDQGYSDKNLRLVCHAINAFRGRMTDEEMLAMARTLIAKADESSPLMARLRLSRDDHILMVA